VRLLFLNHSPDSGAYDVAAVKTLLTPTRLQGRLSTSTFPTITSAPKP
jgi:hypothetical protein